MYIKGNIHIYISQGQFIYHMEHPYLSQGTSKYHRDNPYMTEKAKLCDIVILILNKAMQRIIHDVKLATLLQTIDVEQENGVKFIGNVMWKGNKMLKSLFAVRAMWVKQDSKY